MERLRATPESYARKIEFIEKAMREGAHEKLPPEGKKMTRKCVDIGLLYNMGSETTEESVGGLYSIRRQRISQINEQFLRNLHRNCSKETQNEFPLETIPFAKPRFQQSRERQSSARGGRSLRTKEQTKKRITDSKQIAENLGLPVEKIRDSKQVLKRWEVKMSTRKNISYKEIEGKIEKEADDKKLQELLDSFSDGSIKGFIHRYKNDRVSFALLGNTLRELGFNHMNARFVAGVLKSAGIPIRHVNIGGVIKHAKEYPPTYYVFLAKHKQRIIDAIKVIEATSDKRLGKMNIELVCGKLDENMSFPSILLGIRQHNNYESVRNFVENITGIKLGSFNKLKIKDFLSGCAIPVFKYRDTYVFPSSKKDEFKVFIEKRAEQIRSESVMIVKV